MKLHKLFVLLLMLASLVAIPATAQDDTTTVIAVNDDTVSGEAFNSRNRFEYALVEQLAQFRAQSIQNQAEQLGVNPQAVAQQDQQFQQWVNELNNPSALSQRTVDTIVNELVVRQYAAEQEITVNEEEIDNARANFFGLDLANASEADVESYQEFVGFFRDTISQTADAQELADFFEYRALIAAVSEQVLADTGDVTYADVAHILVETEEEAQDILTQLEEGADFATLAQEQSIDTGSGANGGSLGTSPLLFYVDAFAEAARTAAIGELTGPVETQFGFHILLVNEREERTPSEQELVQIENVVLRNWIDDLLETAEVEIDDAWTEFAYSPQSDVEGPEELTAPVAEAIMTRYDDILQGVDEDGFPLLGDPEAPVTITQYASFTCPVCRNFHDEVFFDLLPYVEAGDVNMVFRPLPAGSLPNPIGAFAAAFCAGEQGMFWEMHDVLYNWHTEFGQTAFVADRLLLGATALGLDTEAFATCAESAAITEQIALGGTLAEADEVTGTPTTYVNGERVQNSLSAIESAIESNLDN
jgi:parvulin-like peptidyl-prolyl isomerase/protein-disulfide isomerase